MDPRDGVGGNETACRDDSDFESAFSVQVKQQPFSGLSILNTTAWGEADLYFMPNKFSTSPRVRGGGCFSLPTKVHGAPFLISFDDHRLGLVLSVTNIIKRTYPVSTVLCLIYITLEMNSIRKVSLGVSVAVGLHSGMKPHMFGKLEMRCALIMCMFSPKA